MGTEIPQWELIKTHDGNGDSTMGISQNPQREQQELVETQNGNRKLNQGTESPQWELVKTHDENRNSTMGIN